MSVRIDQFTETRHGDGPWHPLGGDCDTCRAWLVPLLHDAEWQRQVSIADDAIRALSSTTSTTDENPTVIDE